MQDAATPLVTPVEMGSVDRAAIASGIDGYGLMEVAGAALSACALKYHPHATRADILCGPGNNGGDGYVAARHLRAAGMPVSVYSLIDPARLSGDAAMACDGWAGPIEALNERRPSGGSIVVDALFGGGLDRAIEGAAAAVIDSANQAGDPVVAADLPSGISGRSGEMFGTALKADHTVTFVAPKPGHYLHPGSGLCGTLQVFDIGIPWRFIDALQVKLWRNDPAAWRAALPNAHAADHKYSHGHLCVFSGGFSSTGAARMAALAGLRAGAGLVTVLAPAAAVAANAAHLTAVMLRKIESRPDLSELLMDERLNAFVLGPAFGIGKRVREYVDMIASAGRPVVLDADGLTSFCDNVEELRVAGARTGILLTPHQGEFARLFPDLAADRSLSKVDRARLAAERVEAVVLYKGADTVIASPDGRAVINANAPPWLATAGSGDCLAGIAGGLLASGMPLFEAAAAAAYMHGEAGRKAGEGMTAEDISNALPALGRLR